MGTRLRCIYLYGFLASAPMACGSSDEPPPIFEPEDSEGSETPPPEEPTSSGVSEGDAVSIAIEAAAAEGHDVESYSDIVVHRRGDHWEVQLRKPRILRFLLVTVSQSRQATVEVRTHQ